MTNAVHPGGLNATQSLTFFHANGIKGQIIPSRGRRTILVEYTCKSQYLNGSIADAVHRISAPAERQNVRVIGDGPNDIPF